MRITNLIGIILMVLAFVGIALCVFSYLWLRKLLAVAIILCGVLTGTLLAVAQAAGML